MPAPVVLLVPVKAWDRAKSRLRVAGGPGAAPEIVGRLARAFAADTVAAAAACPAVAEVVVVTDGEPVELSPGVRVLADEGRGDLNAALRAAEAQVRADGRGVAALCADLPCLAAHDLAAALGSVSDGRAFVTDAAGSGTTLLIAAPGHDLAPAFGPGSARRHLDSGAVPVTLAVPTLRRDVDTPDDLEAAAALGLGVHTRAALARPRA